MPSFKSQYVGFVANYQCPVHLGYICEFLLLKALTGWPLKLSTMQATINITKWDPVTWPIYDTCSETGHKIYNISFLLDVKYRVAPDPSGFMEQVYGLGSPWAG